MLKDYFYYRLMKAVFSKRPWIKVSNEEDYEIGCDIANGKDYSVINNITSIAPDPNFRDPEGNGKGKPGSGG